MDFALFFFQPIRLVVLVCAVVGMIMLFRRSRIRRSLMFSLPVLAALLLINAGVLFRVMHWPGSSALLALGGVLLGGAYAVWFMRKTSKSTLDWLKLVWLGSVAFTLFWLAFYWPGTQYLAILVTVAFWAMLLHFVYVTYVRRAAVR